MTTATAHEPITCCGHEGEHEWQGPIFGCEYHGCGTVATDDVLTALIALEAEVRAWLDTDEAVSDWNWGDMANAAYQARAAIRKAQGNG